MRQLLIAVAGGAFLGIASCILSDSFAQADMGQARTAVLFFDQIESAAKEEPSPPYAEGVAAIGEKLRDCGNIELHFVPRQNFVHSEPFVGVFWDELNDVQADCVMRLMRTQSVLWIIDESEGPTQLGLQQLHTGFP